MTQSSRYQLNIRTRLLLLCLGVATPLLAIGSFFLWKQYKTLRIESQRVAQVEASFALRSVSQWLKMQRESVHALAVLSANQRPEAVAHILNTAIHTQPNWTEIFLVEPSGKLIGYAANQSLKPKTYLLMPRGGFGPLQNAETQPAVSGYVASPLSGRPSILVTAPLNQFGRAKSLLIAAIQPTALLKIFQGLPEESGTVITVVDGNKRVIIRTLHDEIWEGQDYSAATGSAADSAAVKPIPQTSITDGSNYTFAIEKVPDSLWSVIVSKPSSAILSSSQNWFSVMLLLTVCAIAVSILLAFLATQYFTGNINLFVKEALAIGRGDLSRRVNVNASDELGTLAHAFNQMATKLEIDQEQKFLVEKLAESIRQSLDLDQILATTVRELGRALSASRCCLALIDANDIDHGQIRELNFDHVWYDSNLAGAALSHRTIPITENNVMHMILEQGSILSLDLLDEEGPSPLFGNSSKGSPDDWKSIRSLIACPIVADHHQPLGLILVHQCDRLRAWSDSELELVETTARHVTLAMQHAQLYQRTKLLAEQEMLINHIVRSVRSSLDLNTILQTATEELAKALGADRCQIAQPNREGPLVVTHEFHTPDLPSGQSLSLYSEPLDFDPRGDNSGRGNPRRLVLGIDLNKIVDPFSSSNGDSASSSPVTVREAPIAVINDTHLDSRTIPFKQFIDQVNSRSLIAAPLLSENHLVGLLIVHQCGRERVWRANEVQLVQAIADQLAIAITHAHLFLQVRHQAITDGLTGLYNHIYFKHRLAEELRLADRKKIPCSLLMLDLDKLKQINDNFGHPVGDAAIRQVAGILKTLLRSGDTAARYGGEEFAVILPETSLLEAALIGDRLCARIANTAVQGLGKITVSIGAASYPTPATDIDELIAMADKALYCAKSAGRNQIWIYEEPGKPIPEFRVPQRLLATKQRANKETQ